MVCALNFAVAYLLALGPRDDTDFLVSPAGDMTLLDFSFARADGEPEPLLQLNDSFTDRSRLRKSPRFANAQTLAQLLSVLGYGPGGVVEARTPSGGVAATPGLEAFMAAAVEAFLAIRQQAGPLLAIVGTLMVRAGVWL